MTTMRIGALTMMSCVRFGACARVPAGPNVGLGSPALASRLTSFQGEDLVCRQWAAQQAGNDTGARVGSEDRARRGHRHAPRNWFGGLFGPALVGQRIIPKCPDMAWGKA
jgi:hypothetical protein